MTAPASAPTRHRGLGIAALVAGIATVAATAIALVLSYATPGPAALATALFGLMIIIVVAAVSIVLGVLAVSLSRPRAAGLWGLGITLATLLGIVIYAVPFGG